MKKRLIQSKWQIIALTSTSSFGERNSLMSLLVVQRASSCAENIHKTQCIYQRSYKQFSMMKLYWLFPENLQIPYQILKNLGLNITKTSPLQLFAWMPNQLLKKLRSSTFVTRILSIIDISLKQIFNEKMEQPKETTLKHTTAKTSRNTSIRNRESLMKSCANTIET